jgi:hypothetical protein
VKDNTTSLIKRVSKGKPKAFQFLLKYAPPKRAIAPNGEKLLRGEIW